MGSYRKRKAPLGVQARSADHRIPGVVPWIGAGPDPRPPSLAHAAGAPPTRTLRAQHPLNAMRLLTLTAASLLFSSTALWAQAPSNGPFSEPPASVFLTQDEEAEEEEAPPQDKRDEVKELLKTLKGHAGARGKEDQQAVEVLSTLMTEFPKSGPKDKASIAKGVAACLKQKRKQNKDGAYDNVLYKATAYALGQMGEEGAKELVKWVGHKQHRGNQLLQIDLIAALGKTKSEKGIKTLTDLLGNKDFAIEAAAAKALFHFDGLKLKKRKEVFNEVLKSLTSAKNAVDADINNQDTTVRERYNAVSAPMMSTLEALSGHKESTPEKWQTWWNKNKKEDWDEMEEESNA